MTETDRALLAERITAERIRQYGTKSAAYQAARINSSTWDHIERGDSVREDRLTAAVKLLWPASGGDWRKTEAVDVSGPAFGGTYDDPDYMGKVEQWIKELEARIEALERARDEQETRHGNAPTTTTAGDGPADAIIELDEFADEEPQPEAGDPPPATPRQARRQSG